MNMRKTILLLAACTLLLWAFGCETTQSITSKLTGGVDESVYVQVPAEDRGGVVEAEEAFKKAREKHKLAELELDRAQIKAKQARAEKSLAENLADEAEAKVELAKWEAVDKAGLGAKDKNIDAIASMKKKIAQIQGDRYTIEANIKKLSRDAAEMDELISEQEGLLKKL
jgi:hypothetical protein